MTRLDGQKLEARFLIHDRDGWSPTAFRQRLRGAGVRPLRIPKLASDAASFCEAWIGAYKREALDYFLCLGLDHFDYSGQHLSSIAM